MHYAAKNSISKDKEILSCIPTYLGTEDYEIEEFLKQMVEEMGKGNTFGNDFFADAHMQLMDTLEDCYLTWNFEQAEHIENNLQNLYELQHLNNQLLGETERNIQVIEFAKDGISTTLLSADPIQKCNLPSEPFVGKKRSGVFLEIKKIKSEYCSKEFTKKIKSKELPTSEIEVEDSSVGLWFHDSQSIQTLKKLLDQCNEYLKIEKGNSVKKEMHELETKNKVIQDYIGLQLELESLELKI